MSEFTCGNLHLTIGIEKIIDQEQTDETMVAKGTLGCIDRTMFEYLDKAFRKDAFPLYNRQTAIVDYIISVSQEMKAISDSLRNPAAHSSSMKCNRAELCGNYILKVQKLLINFLNKIHVENCSTPGNEVGV